MNKPMFDSRLGYPVIGNGLWRSPLYLSEQELGNREKQDSHYYEDVLAPLQFTMTGTDDDEPNMSRHDQSMFDSTDTKGNKKTSTAYKIVALVLLLVFVALLIWKWRAVVAFLTLPFCLVDAMFKTAVVITSPAPTLASQLMAMFGFVTLPAVRVITVKSTILSLSLAVLSNAVFLAALAALGWAVYSYFSK